MGVFGSDGRASAVPVARFVAAAAVVACVNPAWAGGPAFTGIAAKADSAETSISNPAGMARLDAPTTTARLVLARGLGEFEVDESRTTTGGGNPDSDTAPVIMPLGFHVRPVNDRWHAGISLTVPTGFGSDYGGEWAGRYYSDYYSLVYVALTPAVSYRVNDQLSLGLGIGINYTLTETEVALNTLGEDSPDGRLETELDGIGTSVTLSLLWQMNDTTRFGFVYTSEAEAELEGELDFRNLGPVLGPILEEQGLVGADVEIENTLPQRVVAGMYHQLPSGAEITVDAMWMQFSEFGTTSVSLAGETLEIDESGAFEDFWGMAFGYTFPAHDGKRWSVGVFGVTAPVDDDERSLALALDRIWGIGGGLSFELGNGQLVDVNLNLIDHGEAPVDTGPDLARGRVVGETDQPYAVVADVAWHF
jgi:long-chain fatty acid transport protein